MRLFLAIELPDALRGEIARGVQVVRRQWTEARWPAGSWVREANLHLTMKFLGEVPDANVPALLQALQALPRVGPFRLQISGPELLPPRGRLRVVAAGLAGDLGPLTELHAHVESACERLHFPREQRAFRPHITLARARNPLPAAARPVIAAALSANLPVSEFDVASLTLMQSTLHRTGSIYTPAAHFPLA